RHAHGAVRGCGRNPREHTAQGLRSHLGPAAAAAHLIAERFARVDSMLMAEHLRYHAIYVLVHPHPAPIDPVLPPPNPGAFHLEWAARGDSVTLTGRDEREMSPLWAPRLEPLASDMVA